MAGWNTECDKKILTVLQIYEILMKGMGEKLLTFGIILEWILEMDGVCKAKKQKKLFISIILCWQSCFPQGYQLTILITLYLSDGIE